MKLKRMYQVVKRRIKEYIINKIYIEECFMDLSQSRDKLKELKNSIALIRKTLSIVDSFNKKPNIFGEKELFEDERRNY